MEKILNHEEIEALGEVQRGERSNPRRNKATIMLPRRATFAAPGHLRRSTRKRSVHCMTPLRETSRTHSGAYFRGTFEVAVVSIEQVAYPDLLQRVPGPELRLLGRPSSFGGFRGG